MKRFFSLFLALLLLLSITACGKTGGASSGAASCGGDPAPDAPSGDEITWTVSPAGVLTISGEGPMPDFDRNHVWDENIQITAVVIKSGVTSVGKYAFFNCPMLTDVTLPEGITKICSEAFGYCRSLREISLPASLEKIQRFAFDGCTSLTTIKIARENPTFRSQNGVVYSAGGGTLLLCPAGKTGAFVVPDGVTAVGEYAFFLCARLTSVTFPQCLRRIEKGAFRECRGLSEVRFGGSRADWDNVDVWDDNEDLSRAKFLFGE